MLPNGGWPDRNPDDSGHAPHLFLHFFLCLRVFIILGGKYSLLYDTPDEAATAEQQLWSARSFFRVVCETRLTETPGEV